MQEGVKIAVTDNELRSQGGQQRRGRLSTEDTDAADACESILHELPTPATLAVNPSILLLCSILHCTFFNLLSLSRPTLYHLLCIPTCECKFRQVNVE